MGWIPWRYWNNVEFVELPGKAGRSRMTEMSGMSLEGLVRHTDAFFRRSPCLLCVKFLFLESGMKVSLPSVCSSSTQRALCLLHVELDSGWRILCKVHV